MKNHFSYYNCQWLAQTAGADPEKN